MAITLNSSTLVTVFGGSGFLGRYVVQALARTGCRVRVAVRQPHLAGFLQPLGSVGQIHPVQANLRFPASVRRAAEGADGVVNLVGILQASGKQNFRAIQAEGAGVVARAAREAGARALVHISAIGANRSSPSAYARSKGEGEDLVSAAFPTASILRPSIVFGPEDDFFNRFASLSRLSPFMPLIGGGRTRFQPVYVADVARAVIAGLDGRARPGVPYELGGPAVYTFRELLDLVAEYTERKRPYFPLPFWLAKLQGAILQVLPNAPLTLDQVRMLQVDNVVSEEAVSEARTLQTLGIEPQALETIVPRYLVRFRPKGEFSTRAI
ncbi:MULTISPECIES: complex I NDUFA9 subunit family protein [Rhodomicrobium]|uniref:complex I NDUFA9 subunit family protein n=1 Tax=Rhodomicrobium TaxID=1068 RepID=UPI000B4ACCB8|nr:MULTISPECIES: complex I NDUFA9 subunit family protein [Rhodomicrobium]